MAGFLVQTCMEIPLTSRNIGSLQALRTLLDIKVYCLTFNQGLEAVAGNCGKMYEYIFAAISRGDKTKTLGIVKPFNCTCSHETYL